MIYFDNAATTMRKPQCVVQAVQRALESFGGVGRGVHGASIDAGMAVFQARQRISDLFGGPGPKRVAFAANATEALNVAICGLMRPGDHAVTTAASHNSVLRPLFRLEDAGQAIVSVVPIGADGSLDYGAFADALRRDTRLVVVTHASNLTGDVY
ncbi:MAG TPA: cysteine desulfurase, partial [Eggerthellaceae bacterium]|nr:cysteine desulfurase [Eggerthellaceae bacterium]